MEKKQIRHDVGSSIDTRKPMRQTPSAFLSNLLVANRALAFLLSPESDEFPPFEPVFPPFRTYAFVEIAFPSWVIGIGSSLDQTVPPDGRVGRLAEANRHPFSLFAHDFPCEDPALGSMDLEVFLLHPAASFVRVSSFGPLPQEVKDSTIHLREGLFACHMP